MSRRNDDIFRLRELAIDRDDARDSLKGDISKTKEQLRPVNLARRAGKVALDQMEHGGQKVAGSIKENLFFSASVLAAVTVATFHKPIGKLIGKGLDSFSEKNLQPKEKSGE